MLSFLCVIIVFLICTYMRYLLIATLFISLFQTLWAQEKVIIQWSTIKQQGIVADNENTLFIINAENFLEEKTNFYKANIAIKGFRAFSGDLKISNLRYESVTSDQFRSSSNIKFPNKFNAKFSIGKARNEFIHTAEITPIICEAGGCKRLVSFEVTKTIGALKASKFISRKNVNLNQSNSVLASGDWKRIQVDTTGVFQITSGILSGLGINPQTTDPNTVKIYGFGGKALPFLNSDNQFFDPPEVAVDVVGGGDGSFGANDRVYFYATGSKGWNSDHRSFVNPYSDVTYYYIRVDGGESKKIQDITEPTGNTSLIFNEYNYTTFFEKDQKNISRQGREWFGSDIDVNLTRSFNFFVPERVETEFINFNFRVAGDYNIAAQLKVTSNDPSSTENVFTLSNPNSNDYVVSTNGGLLGDRFDSENINLNLEFDKRGDPSSIVNLDFISLTADCKLRGYGKQFNFTNNQQAANVGTGEYVISNAQNIESIWNVTDPFNISKKDLEGASQVRFKIPLGSQQTYHAFDVDDVYTPIIPNDSRLRNQDIKGTVFRNRQGAVEAIDYLIITHSSLVPAAERLAQLRSRNGLNSKILTVESIYNEFSCGQQDIGAIRNAIRYIYENAPSENERLQFVCMLGTPSYDYKNRIEGNVNLVPIFHTINGNRSTSSFPSDDYYVMMDESEGRNIVSDKMDIAIGRIIAADLNIANKMVDKIASYEQQRTKDSWRRNFTFIADDPDTGARRESDAQLQVMTNFAADRLNSNVPRTRINKLFADAFAQVPTSAGPKYPQVANQIINSFENGSLMSFYLGHGGVRGLADESLFTSRTATDLTNETRPNIFVTVTCELTRFDDPVNLSAGELLFLNERGGALALVTTVRDIFVSVALNFYPLFVDSLFDTQKQIIPIGEALRQTKLGLSSSNKRSVFCIGDPALLPGLPPEGIKVDAINNDQAFNSELIINEGEATEAVKPIQVLQGLSRVVLEGSLLKTGSTEVDKSFNGVATISIFDKDRLQRTLANDGFMKTWTIQENDDSFSFIGTDTEEPAIFEFNVAGKLLFNGKASVKNGKYKAEFIMPRNIGEEVGQGTISIYAQNTQLGTEKLDIETITLGGLATDVPEDSTPPEIEIFLNDINFQEGQSVSAEPLIIAQFTDESGINASGGIGHDIIAIIDGDEANPVVLNEFYESEIDDFTRGRIEYRLLGLDDGEHTLEVRVSDTYNNVSSKVITFNSVNSDDFDIQRVLNYPNPFTSKTGFWFSHTGSPNLELDVFVQVFTVTGKIVKSLRTNMPLRNQSSYEGVLMWDGRDDFGKKIGKGTYLYKISVKSPLLNKTVTKIEKLVIL